MTEPFSGWLYESGIGENRAVLVENGELVRIRNERENGELRVGTIVDAKFANQWAAGRSGVVELPNGQEALLQPLPKGLTEGAIVRVEIVREAIQERRGHFKRAKAKPAIDCELNDGQSLLEALEASSQSVKEVFSHGDDMLGQYGWHEAIEQAATGQVDFDGGCLLISVTPAMTVVDVDGSVPPVELAKRAAKEVAIALRKLDISGNVGVDFPTLEAKADRSAIAQTFDDHMAADCERTAINGFGFMQIVSRKVRPSIIEMLQANRSTNAALQLLRQAERDRGTGGLQLTVHPAIESKLKPEWLEELARRTGRTVTVETVGNLSLFGGQVSAV